MVVEEDRKNKENVVVEAVVVVFVLKAKSKKEGKAKKTELWRSARRRGTRVS